MEKIRKFTITITDNEDGQTINRTNEGIAPHELIGVCHVIIAETTKKIVETSERTTTQIFEKEMD